MKEAEMRKVTCCFTGHRNLPKNNLQDITDRTLYEIRSLITNNGVRFFGVGGAIGYDTLAAELLFQLKQNEFPHIKIILVYPFDGFTNCWTSMQKENYNKVLPKYDKIVCVSNNSSREAYLKRNRRLVNGSAYCISYCTRNYGGTAYTIKYAKQQKLEIRNISDYKI